MLATGMTHLSAVSGSNVAVVLAAGIGLCRRPGHPAALATGGGGRRCWPASSSSPGPSPACSGRPSWGSIGLMGLSASRRRAGVPALAGAVVVLLVVDPWLSRSFGFALSTLATLGLLLFARPWGAAVRPLLPDRAALAGRRRSRSRWRRRRCAARWWCCCRVRSRVVGVLANLLAAPFVAPATVLGVAVALLAVVAAPVAAAVAWLAEPARRRASPGWHDPAPTCRWATLPWPDGHPGRSCWPG